MMRHGRQFSFLMSFFFLLLSACGKKYDGPPRWDSFPVTIYTDPNVVKDAQAHSDFQDAMHFWEQIVGKQLFDYRGDWNGQVYSGGDSISQNSLFAQSPWSYASNIAAQTIVLSQSSQIQGAVIMVNPNTSFCGGDCTGQRSSTSMRKVFAHELGHFIGLSHVQDTSNIMYPDALPGGSLQNLSVDLNTLQQLVQ
jgi:hypothetical protein